ncbi:hypothetical protein GCM10011371_13610 [Novosphingobium marinum]|uniref:DUF1993 domain-containing protein n=1 Tax=Novosphingobium marinum TaxID=1514948 RepID=A0A7Y9XVR7_9SPHN|nr:DUF1993 domain-containing protein [Novosphingobium marinum]NYH95469.1 hypothetical protein [Novosphingobium marinum]GGC27339.1 hypothetical protein GCM10011371_13610 [Novosphingobium marinum]
MPISLHDATVGAYLHMLPNVLGMFDKAEQHCRDADMEDRALLAASLSDDMWDFSKQIDQVVLLSERAVRAMREGTYYPDLAPVDCSFDDLRAMVSDAIAFLETVTPEELETIADKDVELRHEAIRAPFSVAEFLLTFSIPNFYFHVTTAYAILRNQGVPVGKADYYGPLRTEPA